MTLWLFDIDGLLVNINDVHVKAYQGMYKGELDKDLPYDDVINGFGLSEADCIKYQLKKYTKVTEQLVKDLMQKHHHYFKETLGTIDVIPLSGVKELLESLTKGNQHVGIITGNVEQNAHLILKRAGLHHYFSIFATDKGVKRWEIVIDAIKQAELKKYDFDKVIVFGDTIHDIEAVKKVREQTRKHIVIVAVATGSCTKHELEAAKPDMVVDNLEQFDPMVAAAIPNEKGETYY
jgi:phosphoglycolate phosphatase-like HAD superfamily hydrolase